MRQAGRLELLEPGQETGVAAELGGDTVIGVTADGERQDDNPRREVADFGHHDTARRLVVVKMGVGEPRIPPLAHAEDGCRPIGFVGSLRCASAGAALPRGQVEYSGLVSGLGLP